MKHQLRAILIKNLKRQDDFLVEPPVLIPKPKKISKFENKTAYILTSECTIHYINEENTVLLNDLNEFLEQISNIKIQKKETDDSDINILNNKSLEILDSDNEEGYNLEIVSNRILIYSIHEKGLFYGIQTLIQLIKNAYLSDKELFSIPKTNRNKFSLPEIEIRDFPDLKIRGIAQDISRGQVFTVKNAKRYIKILSHYKMNFYCVYIEDMFAHPKYPLIGKARGALTIDEIKELDIYAKQRYLELVPIFECLGHVDNILQHKRYQDLGEFPGAHSLNISNPEIYPILSDFISEMSMCFSTNYFHIGCDESFDIGKWLSKEYIEEKGKNEALVGFYGKIYQIARENNNKFVIMYDDIVRHNEKILEHLNKDLILMYWDYNPKKNYPIVEKLLNAGFKVIVSPSMLNWQRNFPDNRNASKNIINLIKVAYKNRNNGCLGVLTCTWGDMRYYSLRENEIYGAVLNGAVAWKTLKFDYKAFKNEFGFLFYGIEMESLEKFNEMFTLLSKSATLYYRISILIPPFFYTYFFKHPFPVKNYEPSFENYEKLGDLANKCLEIYNELKPKVVFEVDNFEYIRFGAEFAKYLREKIDISLKVSEILSKSEISKEDIESILSDLNYIKEKILYLKEQFEKLWLRAAKRPCLDIVLNLFDFLIKCYNEKIAQINNHLYFKDPYLDSEWIWANKTSGSVNPCYFRKIININQPIKNALIQGIAGNYMKIYVNNKFIGEVLSRYSMSILPIILRVKSFDITNHLISGKNIIAIEAFDYEVYKGAVNIYGQILLADNTIQEIKTDKTWVSTNIEIFKTDDWTKMEYNDVEWGSVKSYGRPPNLNGDVFKPNLLNGEISITQDYFGFEQYYSNFASHIPTSIDSVIKIMKPFG